MKIVPLGEVANVFNGKTPSKADQRDHGHPVLKIKDVTEGGMFVGDFTSFVDDGFAKQHRSRTLRADDVLVLNAAHNADYVGSKQYRAEPSVEGAVATGEWLIARTRNSHLDQGFLWHWVQSPGTRFQIKKIVKGIHLYPKDVAALDIPLPPISEQRRIAAILDKADAIRRKHEQALALADGFLRSTFLHMFGDPVTNPKGLKRVPLREVATFTSGGTPSKAIPAFWEGTFPWVSPKDMKKLRIVDAQDHISAEAIVESNLKKLPEGTILIVVRGMILVHTVPIAMAGRELAINQDVKAINVDRRVCGQFAFWNLRVQHKHILARVGTAAHGTRRLDTETCERLPILLPNKEQQKDFCALASNFGRARDIVVFQLAAANALFASLSQQAFRGEL